MQKVLSMNTYRASTFGSKAFAFAKRFFDIMFSLVLIVVLLPLGAVVSVIAAFDTKGTPIFIQTRMGRNNVPFKMLKFRTMSVNAPSNVATCRLDDPKRYISKVGGLLRRLSIDELPQLVNIFLGQMSFVGPRPVVLTETELLELRTRNGACSVRPGLTGVAQTSGRDKVTINEKAKMDAFYANNACLQLDCRVLMLTVGYVLRSQDICEGAPASKEEGRRADRSA
ncbi:MAG TPA: sugar transferase [Firmicutes bacterium]|nr:sugar transferase [Bacillota bacterium]